MIQPEALNCPNCGGAVMSDLTNCRFCSTRLKTVGCAKCLGMMFLGSKFCGHCGATAHPAELLDDANAGNCPRCKVKLQLLKIDTVQIRECERCGGFWSAGGAFENLCSDREKQGSVLGFAGSYRHENPDPPTISYVPCPDCTQLMNRSNFARSSGIIIDMCKQHGVWFDAGELPKIIEFIDKGGLYHAREKEKLSILEERSRLRDEQRRLATMSRLSGDTKFDNERSGSLGRFVKLFFD